MSQIRFSNGSTLDFVAGQIVWVKASGELLVDRPPYGAEPLLLEKVEELTVQLTAATERAEKAERAERAADRLEALYRSERLEHEKQLSWFGDFRDKTEAAVKQARAGT